MMTRFPRELARVALVAAAMLLAVGGVGGAAVAQDIPSGPLVNDVPKNGTPHVLNGRVYSVGQVGNTMVLGGTFTSARNDSSATALSRPRLVAFDETSGTISQGFTPNVNGTVNVVLPTGDGQTVYVGGSFTSISGVSVSNLAKVRISDGGVVAGFQPGRITGQVKDLRLANGQLWVAGGFTHVDGTAQKALATVNPGTGALTDFFRGVVAGVHNDGYTTVSKIDTTPDGSRLVAVGNFDTLEEVKDHQLFVLDTSGATAEPAGLRTSFYQTACSQSFDSYMRDVDVSPDGKFFVVSTTGAYGGANTACDSTARFDFANSGDNVKPSWINNTGGDTTYGVEITDRVVYTGGHARWQNNPFAGDRPGPGAMARPGIAALDPVNGLPYSWNPTRTRGVGAFDFLTTPKGLWVTSDTDRIGQAYLYHGRVALMPSTGGSTVPAMKDAKLPNDVYLAGMTGAATDPNVLYRVNAAGPELPANTGIDWSADTPQDPSPYVNPGNNAASYGPVSSVDASVPATTPQGIFSNELWDGSGGDEMHWSFPVPVNTEVKVRLYFANRYSGTSGVGQRVFDVDIDGQTVLDDYDIAGDVGHDRGVMKSFDVMSDGQVDVSLGHVVENPLINGLEIVLKNSTGESTAKVLKRSFDGETPGGVTTAPEGAVDWDAVRGAFMLNGEVYTTMSNGSFTKRTFDGATFGATQAVDEQDQLVVLQDWRADASNMTGMFLSQGRIYFTLPGSNQLYYRYFNPESKVVGAVRWTASAGVAGIDFSKMRGMFLADGKLFWRTSNGDLHRGDWKEGFQSGSVVPNTAELISGPTNGGPAWDSRAFFVYQDKNGKGAPFPPTAAFTTDCTSLTCTFDASGSSAPGSSIASYQWTFGDGTTDTGKVVTKTFATSRSYPVELKVTTAEGGVSSSSQTVQLQRVNEAPKAAFTSTCGVLSCDFDSSTSSDDDEIASRVWDFGDDSPGSDEVSPTHPYAQPGAYTVTLTVTDSDGAVAEVEHTVDVDAEPSSDVSFVAGDSTNGNRSTHSVDVPSGVKAGDRLLLFLSVNSSTPTATPPTGWTEVRAVDASGAQAWVWARAATGQDAGSAVSVSLSSRAKGSLTVAAYRSATGTPLVSQSAADTARGATDLEVPGLAADSGDWVVRYWGVKSSPQVSLSGTGGVTRSSSVGSGGGGVFSWLADSDGPVPAGQVSPQTAQASVSVSRSVTFALTLGTP